jgi:hypothetical protein
MENIAWGRFFFDLKIYYKICKKSSRAPKKSFAGTEVPAGIRLAITALRQGVPNGLSFLCILQTKVTSLPHTTFDLCYDTEIPFQDYIRQGTDKIGKVTRVKRLFYREHMATVTTFRKPIK